MTPRDQIPPDEGAGDQESRGDGFNQGDDVSFANSQNNRPLGWLDPDKREWRHPSEATRFTPGGTFIFDDAHAVSTITFDLRRERRTWIMSLIGTGASVAAIIGLIVLLSASSGVGRSHGLAFDQDSASLTTLVVQSPRMPATTQTAAQAMVSLKIITSQGTRTDCGVAVSAGGLVVTTASSVAGAKTITASTPTLRDGPVKILGLDQGSNIALLQVPIDLPVPTFADTTTLIPGSSETVLSLVRKQNGLARVAWSSSVVSSLANTPTIGPLENIDGISALFPGNNVPALPGDLLLNSSGSVVGILDTSSTSAPQHTALYIPSQLAIGVASDIQSSGKVQHGWLGVVGSNEPTQTNPNSLQGVLIQSVEPNAPATNVLLPGDIIVAVDGFRVRTMAELHSRLYALTPGTSVVVTIIRAGEMLAVRVTLGSSP